MVVSLSGVSEDGVIKGANVTLGITTVTLHSVSPIRVTASSCNHSNNKHVSSIKVQTPGVR